VDSSDVLDACTGFDWDDCNVEKNWELHRVAFWESEACFFNRPLVVSADHKHATAERCYRTLGQADAGRYLFISFTVRNSLIRVISARDMTRREVRAYERSKA